MSSYHYVGYDFGIGFWVLAAPFAILLVASFFKSKIRKWPLIVGLGLIAFAKFLPVPSMLWMSMAVPLIAILAVCSLAGKVPQSQIVFIPPIFVGALVPMTMSMVTSLKGTDVVIFDNSVVVSADGHAEEMPLEKVSFHLVGDEPGRRGMYFSGLKRTAGVAEFEQFRTRDGRIINGLQVAEEISKARDRFLAATKKS